MTWYVVVDSDLGGDERDRRFRTMKVWTVSQDPEWPGWETDSACPGYGLSKEDAEFLAAAANEKECRDAAAALTHT